MGVSVGCCTPNAPLHRQTLGEADKRIRLQHDHEKMDGDCPLRWCWLRSWSDLTRCKDPDEQSQEDLGRALRKTPKVVTFSQKAKNYLVDVFWTAEETVKKATASDIASQMRSLRDDTGQKIFFKTE